MNYVDPAFDVPSSEIETRPNFTAARTQPQQLFKASESNRDTTKPTNPKDAQGVKKFSLSYVSAPVLAEVAVGMTEGGYKYGKHNYRVIGVKASIYYDATIRHLMQWWEGENNDAESDAKLSHITKAICSLVVLRDAMIQHKFSDDRPPKTIDPAVGHQWYDRANQATQALNVQYPNPVAPYREIDVDWSQGGTTKKVA